MPTHDPAYRQFFSHPRMVEDLLQGFVHEDWVAGLDFSTLERINAHFVTKRLRKRESDVIWGTIRGGTIRGPVFSAEPSSRNIAGLYVSALVYHRKNLNLQQLDFVDDSVGVSRNFAYVLIIHFRYHTSSTRQFIQANRRFHQVLGDSPGIDG
jgi:hypothetical protein